MINSAEVKQRRWLEESGQWLENVDRSHLVFASGKPVLQIFFYQVWFHPTTLDLGGSRKSHLDEDGTEL